MRNNIPIYSWVDDKIVSHFSLREFENPEGIVVLDSRVPAALEHIRQEVCLQTGEDSPIQITDGCRTRQDLDRLAQKYGWIDEGGRVSRNSKHLIEYGGVAVDFVAYTDASRKEVLPIEALGNIARSYFLYVQTYSGHVHADFYDRGIR